VELDGCRALVVGASSGIGREVGLQLAAGGARVVFSARRIERLEEAVASAGAGARAVACDVREAGACDRLIADTVAFMGGLDVLVFATAIDPLVRLRDASGDVWSDVLTTNVIGASLVCKAALSELQASSGRAVFVSATSVGRPLPGMGVYEVSKAALEELVRAWRGEHPEIGFSTVAVGNTLGTEVTATWDMSVLGDLHGTWEGRGYIHDNGPGAMTVAQAAAAVVVAITSPADLRYVVANPPPGSTMDHSGGA
jgi:NAD(P)-dependent dehydrogenase (short-subunit alcohol dehydrogenase family)